MHRRTRLGALGAFWPHIPRPRRQYILLGVLALTMLVRLMHQPVDLYPGGLAAMCAIVKDEEAYLDEWIDYHLGAGFSHIYLYDNSADFAVRSWRSHRPHNVTVVHYPTLDAPQQTAYQECAREFGRNHRWMAFWDVDEFLVMHVHESVEDLLAQHLSWGGSLALNWIYFGCWTLTYHPAPVTYRFRAARLPDPSAERHVKALTTVADMNLDKPQHAHYSHLKWYRHHVDTDGHWLSKPLYWHDNGPTNVAVLHHFAQKSVAEYADKRKRGRADKPPGAEKYVDLTSHPPQMANGTLVDDAAWQQLKRHCPIYGVYEQGFASPIANEPVAVLCTRVDANARAEYYVDEWAAYHAALGLSMIVYADNDDLTESVVNLTRVELVVGTNDWWTDCQQRASTEWVGAWDLHEFLVLAVDQSLTDALQGLTELQAAEYPFGSSSHLVYEPKPVTKRFVFRKATPARQRTLLVRRSNGTAAKLASAPWRNGDAVQGPILHSYSLSHKEMARRNQTDDESASLVWDDSAWQALMRFHPRYEIFEYKFC